MGIRNAGVKGKSEQAFKGAEESGKFFLCVCVVIIIFFFLNVMGSHSRVILYRSEIEFLSHELAAKSGYLRCVLQFLQRLVPM